MHTNMKKTYNKPSVKTLKLNTESLLAASMKLYGETQKHGNEALGNQESDLSIWDNNGSIWE